MKLNRLVTGGLAWAGVALVVGVPLADVLLRPKNEALTVTSGSTATADAARVAVPVVVPAKTHAAAPIVVKTANSIRVTPAPSNDATAVASADATVAPGNAAPGIVAPGNAAPGKAAPWTDADLKDPVGHYLSTNKKLPDYITGGSQASPAPTANAAPASDAVTAPQMPAATAEAPVADPQTPASDLAAIAPEAPIVAPIPMPASARPKPQVVPPADSAPVTEADLKGWKSGSLEDYLRQQNLLTQSGGGANADVPLDQQDNAGHGGYYLPTDSGY